MAKIKVISKCELYDGMSITFKAPCDCTAVDGLNVYYNEYSQPFSFRDAHVNDLAGLDGLFTEGAYIKAILDTRNGYAYLQNADTNAFIENDLYTKEETLTAATIQMYGLNENATPNTVFQKLAMPYGYYGFDVTTVFSDGTVASNITLDGLLDISGNVAVTDENGRYETAMSDTATPTVTVSNYLDVVDYEGTLSTKPGEVFTPVTIVLEKVAEETTAQITATTTKLLSGSIESIDFTVVGGGGGGSCKSNSFGGGGGGGYVTTLLNVQPSESSMTFTIGSGGSGGTANGGAGGTSSVAYPSGTVLATASGGKGASNGSGGAGNGAGGAGWAKGSNATGYLFDDSSLGLAGGGGGGGGYGYNGSAAVVAGGKPYGGHGEYVYGPEDSAGSGSGGTGPGGGGGGGSLYVSSHGYAGHRGTVYWRVRYKS